MSEVQHNNDEGTAVDDVRRVREKIARQHRGDLRGHIEETNRIAAQLRARLNVKLVQPPADNPSRVGSGSE